MHSTVKEQITCRIGHETGMPSRNPLEMLHKYFCIKRLPHDTGEKGKDGGKCDYSDDALYAEQRSRQTKLKWKVKVVEDLAFEGSVEHPKLPNPLGSGNARTR